MLSVMRQTFYGADVDCTGELFSTFPPEIYFYADPLLSIHLSIQATPYFTSNSNLRRTLINCRMLDLVLCSSLQEGPVSRHQILFLGMTQGDDPNLLSEIWYQKDKTTTHKKGVFSSLPTRSEGMCQPHIKG